MHLDPEVLFQRLENVPGMLGRSIVWHLCRQSEHMQCSNKLGKLATVTCEPPIIPDENQEGLFLMRLLPLERDVYTLSSGNLGVWLPAAGSFFPSTVWAGPEDNLVLVGST